MANNRRILRILERCPDELLETSKFRSLIAEDLLRFKEPVKLDQLKNFRFEVIIQEASICIKSTQAALALRENIHNAEAVFPDDDDFI